MLQFLNKLAHDLILTLEVLVSIRLSQMVDFRGRRRNLSIQSIDDLLEVLERLLDLADLLLALLIVLVHLIFERLEAEALQVVEILAQARQVDLILPLQCLGNLLERLHVFRGDHAVLLLVNILLDVLGVRHVIISNTARNLSGTSVAINLLLDKDKIRVGNSVSQFGVADFALKVVEAFLDLIKLAIDLLIQLLNLAQ